MNTQFPIHHYGTILVRYPAMASDSKKKKNNAGTTSRPPYTWGGNAMHFSYQAVKNFNKEAMKYLSISLIRYTLGRKYFRQSCHIIVMWIHSLAFIQLIQQDLTVLVWQFIEFRSLLSVMTDYAALIMNLLSNHGFSPSSHYWFTAAGLWSWTNYYTKLRCHRFIVKIK